MSHDTTASSSNPSSAGEGITGGYNGDSLTLKIFIAFFLGLAMYNVVELLVIILGTFTRYKGLYFWSLVISSIGIIPYALGFLFKYFSILEGNSRWVSVVLLTIGWYPMVTGQAVVLWSRLHLVMEGGRRDTILWWTKWMIVINAVCLHVPTTVLTFGSNAGLIPFIKGYNVMEKIQMCGFFCQEIILSSIYIVETIKILKTSIQQHTRRLMYQLLAINILIIILDLGLLGLECASLYILETITKGVFYSLKLKLEFAILSKLVQFVGGGRTNSGGESSSTRRRSTSLAFIETEKSESQGKASGFNPYDVADFVDLSKVKSDVTFAAPSSERQGSVVRQGISDFDYDLAQLEHSESRRSGVRRPNGDIESHG